MGCFSLVVGDWMASDVSDIRDLDELEVYGSEAQTSVQIASYVFEVGSVYKPHFLATSSSLESREWLLIRTLLTEDTQCTVMTK
jgi:hypothetical protein